MTEEEWSSFNEETMNRLTYGCYILRNERDETIYIGSGFCVERLWAHAPFYKGRPEETFPDAVSFKIIWCADKKESEKVEKKLISEFKEEFGIFPKYNKQA